MFRLMVLAALVTLAGMPTSWAATMSWQEAVARLAQEQTHVETCVAVIKARGDVPARERAFVTYGKAKAEVDGVIKGLVAALADGASPASLPELSGQMDRAAAGRDALCQAAQVMLPPDLGDRGPLAGVVGGVFGPVADAVKELILAGQQQDELRRRTIQAQVEATRWPAYSDIPPALF